MADSIWSDIRENCVKNEIGLQTKALSCNCMIFHKRHEMKEEHLVVNNENKPLSMKIHICTGGEFKMNMNDEIQVTHHPITELGLAPANSRCRGRTRDNYQ
jgi:hypothetical protein